MLGYCAHQLRQAGGEQLEKDVQLHSTKSTAPLPVNSGSNVGARPPKSCPSRPFKYVNFGRTASKVQNRNKERSRSRHLRRTDSEPGSLMATRKRMVICRRPLDSTLCNVVAIHWRFCVIQSSTTSSSFVSLDRLIEGISGAVPAGSDKALTDCKS